MTYAFDRMEDDRRSEPRLPVTRPCKVYEPRTGKYVPGTTCNVSSGGLLLRLSRSLPVEPGSRLLVGVAARRRQAIIARDELLEGVVTRTMASPSGETMVAIRFPQRDATLSLRLAA